MNFLNLEALYLLLLIPPVIILYFMKLRRKSLIVTASFLWKKVMQDARVDSFFQKLRVNILLILQILFIIFLIFALMRPYFRQLGALSAETIFILDTSASMKTIEGKKTRFALAKEKIDELLSQAQTGSAFMLITASNESRILSGFTGDKTRIRRLLDQTSPTDTGTNLKPAVLLALSLLKSHPEAEIFLVGDKIPKDKDLKLEEIPKFHFISVGSNQQNIGITSFDVSRSSRKGQTELFVKVENFAPEHINTFLEISFNDILGEAREISLPPGGTKGAVFQVPADFSGGIKAELTLKDGLAIDNIAQAEISKPRDIKILLVSGENPFLEKLLALLQGVTVEITDEQRVKSLDLKNYAIVIWNNCTVPAISSGNHLFIACQFQDNKITRKGRIEYPRVMSWESAHPLFRFLDLSEIAISECEDVILPPESKVLIQGDRGPLMFLLERKSFRGIFILFDLFKTDWQLHPSFPIFIANMVDFFSREGRLSGIENHRTGENLVLEFIHPGERIELKNPGNIKADNLNIVGEAPSITLNWVGVYKVKAGDKTYVYPANLLDRDESDIKPDPPMEVKGEKTRTGKTNALIKEIWAPLALLALLLLILEWYIFHIRRV